MRILVTGGAGYVGSTLVPVLLDAGHHVRVLDNLMYGGDGLLQCFSRPAFEFARGDVTDESAVRGAAENVDAVVHLAAIVGFPACRRQPDLAQHVNVGGAEVLADVIPADVRIIYASTGSNYGAVDGVCTEESPLAPLSHYAVTKCAAEEILMSRSSSVALRFATAFGLSPRLRLDLLINDFTFQALKRRTLVVYEKHHKRSFIHVRDMARAFLHVLDGPPGVFNVGLNENNCTKQHVCEMLRERLDFFLHYAEIGEDEDARNYEVSYEKIEAAGFRGGIDLETGLEELIRGLHVIDITNPYSNA